MLEIDGNWLLVKIPHQIVSQDFKRFLGVVRHLRDMWSQHLLFYLLYFETEFANGGRVAHERLKRGPGLERWYVNLLLTTTECIHEVTEDEAAIVVNV